MEPLNKWDQPFFFLFREVVLYSKIKNTYLFVCLFVFFLGGGGGGGVGTRSFK